MTIPDYVLLLSYTHTIITVHAAKGYKHTHLFLAFASIEAFTSNLYLGLLWKRFSKGIVFRKPRSLCRDSNPETLERKLDLCKYKCYLSKL